MIEGWFECRFYRPTTELLSQYVEIIPQDLDLGPEQSLEVLPFPNLEVRKRGLNQEGESRGP